MRDPRKVSLWSPVCPLDNRVCYSCYVIPSPLYVCMYATIIELTVVKTLSIYLSIYLSHFAGLAVGAGRGGAALLDHGHMGKGHDGRHAHDNVERPAQSRVCVATQAWPHPGFLLARQVLC